MDASKPVAPLPDNASDATAQNAPDVDAASVEVSNSQIEKKVATAAPLKRGERLLFNISHAVVLVLSLLLIIYISYDTFQGVDFMSNHHYMTFQFWVCIAFLLDFFIELFISRDKKFYFKARWLFLVISIPYLNIINQFHLHLSAEVLFYIRFVPLLRGAYSLAMVLGYVSHNRAASLLTQYGAILIVLMYSLALVFFYEEYGVNKNVHSFWDALYWAAMNTCTVGCYFSAVTTVGKIISVVLPIAGMLILPLFTVYFTSKVHSYDAARSRLLGVEQSETPLRSESRDDGA